MTPADFFTAEILNGAGVVALVVVQGWMIATGRLVTRREAQFHIARAEKAEAAAESLIKQNGELMEMARLGQATFTALRQGAE